MGGLPCARKLPNRQVPRVPLVLWLHSQSSTASDLVDRGPALHLACRSRLEPRRAPGAAAHGLQAADVTRQVWSRSRWSCLRARRPPRVIVAASRVGGSGALPSPQDDGDGAWATVAPPDLTTRSTTSILGKASCAACQRAPRLAAAHEPSASHAWGHSGRSAAVTVLQQSTVQHTPSNWSRPTTVRPHRRSTTPTNPSPGRRRCARRAASRFSCVPRRHRAPLGAHGEGRHESAAL
jgi:hypothetical protein